MENFGPDAVAWCMSGAIHQARLDAHIRQEQANQLFDQLVENDDRTVAVINDAPNQTQKQVIAMMMEAEAAIGLR